MKGSAAGTISPGLAERMGANIKTMLFTLRKRAVMMKKRVGRQREVSAMLQSEKVKRAIDAVKEACGHCEVCSPDCPIASPIGRCKVYTMICSRRNRRQEISNKKTPGNSI